MNHGYLYLGGIAGHLSTSSDNDATVRNCANYGSVTHLETVKVCSYIGGIVGYDGYALFENYVSADKITPKEDDRLALEVLLSIPSLIYCFWTNGTGVKDTTGHGNYLEVNNSQLIIVDTESVKELDEYAVKNEWSRWVYNRDKGSVKFIVDDMNGTTLPDMKLF